MATLKKYNLKGEAVGNASVDANFLAIEANGQMIKDYIVAIRANARQWSANTRGRTEVNHSNKKPWRQKGTGNARQGTLAAPQFKGGGVVFGPKPKFDQHIRVNRKERRLAVRFLLAEKIKNNQVIVVEDSVFNGALTEPKTQVVANFLKGHNIYGRPVLFVCEALDEQKDCFAFRKSTQNLPRSSFAIAANINGYDVMKAHGIVMTESALKELTE